MALTMYMKVTGKNQGEIKGSCDQGGDKKDKILVYAMDHKVEIPKDTHTGLPTGQRIHHPLTVTKAKDVASPKLFAACCKGEQVDVELDFYRIKPTGEEELYYKITINDAYSNHLPAGEQTISRHGGCKLHLLKDYLVLQRRQY